MSNVTPVFLLTGPSRIGKTTVIQKLYPLLKNYAGGFYSPEVKQNGLRVGFEIVTLDGSIALISTKNSKVVFPRETQLGNHRVNLDLIDSLLVPKLLTSAQENKIVVVDEIGPMEILSSAFREAILQLLDSSVVVVGTIAELSDPFIDRVKAHPRVVLISVNVANRDNLPRELYAKLLRYIEAESNSLQKGELT